MARTPSITPLAPEQRDAAHHEKTADLTARAPEVALESKQGLAGSAAGIGSVGFDDVGAYDVSAGEEAKPAADPVSVTPRGAPPRDAGGRPAGPRPAG